MPRPRRPAGDASGPSRRGPRGRSRAGQRDRRVPARSPAPPGREGRRAPARRPPKRWQEGAAATPKSALSVRPPAGGRRSSRRHRNPRARPVRCPPPRGRSRGRAARRATAGRPAANGSRRRAAENGCRRARRRAAGRVPSPRPRSAGRAVLHRVLKQEARRHLRLRTGRGRAAGRPPPRRPVDGRRRAGPASGPAGATPWPAGPAA